MLQAIFPLPEPHERGGRLIQPRRPTFVDENGDNAAAPVTHPWEARWMCARRGACFLGYGDRGRGLGQARSSVPIGLSRRLGRRGDPGVREDTTGVGLGSSHVGIRDKLERPRASGAGLAISQTETYAPSLALCGPDNTAAQDSRWKAT
jgi:hypothetical protein